MKYEFEVINNEETSHFIYLDNNIFRLLKREPAFWNNFYDFFTKEHPNVFDRIELLFTWAQVMEDLNLGTILKEIQKSPLWEKKINLEKLFKTKEVNDALDYLFIVAKEILSTLPELEKENLLVKIETSITIYGSTEASILIKNTLLKAKDIIQNANYIDELSTELAWAFITSQEFIKSTEQWINRKTYLYSLIVLWHKLMQDKFEFNFYRLAERRYADFIQYSPDSNTKNNIDQLVMDPIKPLGDLCDGEIIHFATIGTFNEKAKKYHKVIGITMDSEITIKQRSNILKQTFIDLKRDVIGWDVNTTPGEIYCLVIDKNNAMIVKTTRIPMNHSTSILTKWGLTLLLLVCLFVSIKILLKILVQ